MNSCEVYDLFEEVTPCVQKMTARSGVLVGLGESWHLDDESRASFSKRQILQGDLATVCSDCLEAERQAEPTAVVVFGAVERIED